MLRAASVCKELRGIFRSVIMHDGARARDPNPRYKRRVAPTFHRLPLCLEGTLARLLFDDLWADDPPTPPWLIPKIMLATQMVVMAGDAGVGKSLLSLVWSQSMACGLPLFGEKVESKNVLYINEENSWYDMREYMRWARYGLDGVSEDILKDRLRVEQMSLTLSPIKWYDNLRLIAEEHKPSLIVIDTATPACQIQDEDKNGEAIIAIGHLRRAMRVAAPDCGMLVLKHAKIIKKGEERSIRGAKAWKGSSDSLIFHTKTAGRPRGDDLHCTYLYPDKSRAFGLKERLKVTPQWVNKGAKKTGILLAYSADPE